jgi:two-component system, chemotaxis family, sensor kinase CheA
MMPGDEVNQKLFHLFTMEAQEAIQIITQSCLALEERPHAARQSDLFADILRQTHNLKGTARALGLAEIAALAHGLETLFTAMQNAGAAPGTAVCDLIYLTLDGIGSLAAGVPSGDIDLERLLDNLETAVANSKTPQPPGAQPPAVVETMPPSDTTTFISQETIRVTVGRLDAILNLVNELQVVRLGLESNLAQMRRLLYDADHFAPQAGAHPTSAQFNDLYRRSDATHRHLSQLLSQLQEHAHQTRMLPLATVFNSLPRMARNLARELGKEVHLHLEGGEIELDRSVLEQIKSPLLHLLQNGIDHGLETSEKRRAAGKPQAGQISITAVQQGSSILIEISDDGVGLDLARIQEHALRQRLLTAEEVNCLDEQETIWLLFQSGFSMTGALTAVSGRGVGLDIVRQAVENLHGMISVENRPGQGVRFLLSLPVSIATSLCLLVQVNSRIFALPTHHITHLTRLRPEQVVWQNGRLLLTRPELEPIPAIRLAHALTRNGHSPDHAAERTNETAVLIGPSQQPVALLVDALCEVQEIVIKNLPPLIAHMPFISGASILSTGAVILVLNATDLIRSAKQRR